MPFSNKLLVAIHGFLGRPSDWDLIENLTPEGWRLIKVDLASDFDAANFESFADQLSNRLQNEAADRTVLLGYSLGGRLAMHALTRRPEFYDGAVICSANPGLQSEAEKQTRLAADEKWAAKFAREAWEPLMREWNSQPVFQTPKNSDAIMLPRFEKDFDRRFLCESLDRWSLGLQRDLREDIQNLPQPLAFVTGEADTKFTEIAREFVAATAKGPREHIVIPKAGHRVPWDAPAAFRAALANYLARWY